jgi:hypothetical protein
VLTLLEAVVRGEEDKGVVEFACGLEFFYERPYHIVHG